MFHQSLALRDHLGMGRHPRVHRFHDRFAGPPGDAPVRGCGALRFERATPTRPVEAASASLPGAYKLQRYYYDYHAAYGSKQHELQDVPVTAVTLSPDRKRVSLEFADLVAWRVYELRLTGIKGDAGSALMNPLVCYTLNRLLENTPPPPKPGREGGKLGVGGAE